MENLTAEDEQSLEQMVSLFNAEKLSKAKSIAKRITITKPSFVGLILAAKTGDLEEMPYLHEMSVFERVPEHLVPTEEEHGALRKNGVGKLQGKAQKFATKMFQLQEERKWIVGHLFFTPSAEHWHLFYFDIKDMDEIQNHWKVGGKHVHYVSSLWPNLSASNVWEKLRSGSKGLGSNVHIRFRG